MIYINDLNLHSTFEVPAGKTDESFVNLCEDENHLHYVKDIDSEDTNTYEFVDLGLPSGNLWAAKNVGAVSSELDGWWFSWGETAEQQPPTGKTNNVYTKTKYFDKSGLIYGNSGKFKLEHEHDAARVNCGGLWEMPTAEDFEELIAYTTSSNKILNSDNGYYRTYTSTVNGNTINFPCSDFKYDSIYKYHSNSPSSCDIILLTCQIDGSQPGASNNYPYAFRFVHSDSLGRIIKNTSTERWDGINVRGIIHRVNTKSLLRIR